MSVAELRHDVETLAGMTRDSAGAGERASAEWAADRLRQLGAAEVRVVPYRYQSTFALAQGAHFALGALAARRGRRLLAAATLASFELDYSGRAQWSRALLPTGEGANAIGTLPARGERTRTLVLVAHHDAARTGLMWDPRMLAAGDAAAERTGRRASLALLPELALLGAVVGGRKTRLAATAVLATAVALSADQARSPTVPGANDNASGVAGVLAVAARLARDRPAGLEVVVLLCGSEEAGMGGMAAWMALGGPGARLRHHARARPRHRGLGGAGGARGRGRPLAGALSRGGRGVRGARGRNRRRAPAALAARRVDGPRAGPARRPSRGLAPLRAAGRLPQLSPPAGHARITWTTAASRPASRRPRRSLARTPPERPGLSFAVARVGM